MEGFKNLYIEIQERFRNPLIFSFIISWFVYNWRIGTLSIHFFTDSNSEMTFKEYSEFVELHLNMFTSLLYPLITALFYILLFPFIRIGLSFLQAWFARQVTRFELLGSKNGSVSIDKYLDLREEYQSKINYLREIIESENSIRIEMNRLQDQLNDCQRYRMEDSERSNKLASKYRNSIINGFWSIKVIHDKNGTYYPITIPVGYEKIEFNCDKIEFDHGNINIYETKSRNVRFSGRIHYFEYDMELEKDKENSYQIFIYADLVEISNNLTSSENNKANVAHKVNLVFKFRQYKNFEMLHGYMNESLSIELRKENKLQL